MEQAMTWLSRRLGWDHNPLRRRADRVEAAVFADGAGPPLSRQAIQLDVTLAVLIAPVALALMLLTAAWSVRLILDRRRAADWERAWDAIGPRWTRQP